MKESESREGRGQEAGRSEGRKERKVWWARSPLEIRERIAGKKVRSAGTASSNVQKNQADLF